jgi:hypothetical protein
MVEFYSRVAAIVATEIVAQNEITARAHIIAKVIEVRYKIEVMRAGS